MHGSTRRVDGADVAIVAASKQLVRVSVYYLLALLMAMCCTLIASSTLKLASVSIETVRILVELVQSGEGIWKCVRCVPRTKQSSKTGVSGDGCPSAATEVKMVAEGVSGRSSGRHVFTYTHIFFCSSDDQK